MFGRPSSVAERSRYVYRPGRPTVPESVAVNAGPSAHHHGPRDDRRRRRQRGGRARRAGLGGWSFHLLGDGRLVYLYNLAGWRIDRIEAAVPGGRLTPGDHTLAMRFEPPAVELLVDGAVIGEGAVRRTAWSRLSLTGAGLTAGWSGDFSPCRRRLPGTVPVHGHAAPGGGGVRGTSRWSIQTPRPKRRSAPSSAGPLGQIPA